MGGSRNSLIKVFVYEKKTTKLRGVIWALRAPHHLMGINENSKMEASDFRHLLFEKSSTQGVE